MGNELNSYVTENNIKSQQNLEDKSKASHMISNSDNTKKNKDIHSMLADQQLENICMSRKLEVLLQ